MKEKHICPECGKEVEFKTLAQIEAAHNLKLRYGDLNYFCSGDCRNKAYEEAV